MGVVGSSWFEGVGDGWVAGFGLGDVGLVGVLEGREWVRVSGLWAWGGGGPWGEEVEGGGVGEEGTRDCCVWGDGVGCLLSCVWLWVAGAWAGVSRVGAGPAGIDVVVVV